MLYSFWKIRLSARGFTLPWQLVELQEPGPVYLLASAGGFPGEGSAARAPGATLKNIAMAQTTAHRSVPGFLSGPILIPSLGWSAPSIAQAFVTARVRNSYTARENRSQRMVADKFPGSESPIWHPESPQGQRNCRKIKLSSRAGLHAYYCMAMGALRNTTINYLKWR